MPYVPQDRLVHDADAHVVETPTFFRDYADPDIRDRIPPLYVMNVAPGEADMIEQFRARHADPEFRARDEEEIMLRKNWKATGSFIPEDRPKALDLIGVASQLVFNTFANGTLEKAERAEDDDYAYGLARAHNRALVDFCSVDKRLLPVCYVPLSDFDRAAAMANEALEQGAAALMIASSCPNTHSPSHIKLDPVWAAAQEAGVPIVFHVGGGGKLLNEAYFENGLPPVKDFHGGDGNFRSVSYMAIQYPVMQTLATLVIDGVFDRFPTLQWGVIEQGGSWLPGLMRALDSSATAFVKNEERLQQLSLKPSEFLRRQLKVTPYPHEDAGWIAEQSGPEMTMFSSDYPHVEGGRNPLARFDKSLENCSDDLKQRFYCDNFIEMMGPTLKRLGVPSAA
jgi:uncharacterized protein